MLLAAYLEGQHRIDAEAVAQTVNELRDETGMAATPPPTAGPGARPKLLRPFVVSSIAARLDLLEKRVKAVVELARGLGGFERRSRLLKGRRG